MKQTAVEYLIENLIFFYSKNWDAIVDQAKEMEKQQQGYSEEEVLELLLTSKIEKHEDIKELFEKFKNK
jgi:hypothetical protein